MLTTKENIRAILECNFAGFKDEYIENALDRIMEIIDDANDIQYAYDQGFKNGYELGKEERPQKVVTIPHELIEKLVLCVVDTVENIDWDKALEAYKERPQDEGGRQ